MPLKSTGEITLKYRYRLKLTKEEKRILIQLCRIITRVANKAMGLNLHYYRLHRKRVRWEPVYKILIEPEESRMLHSMLQQWVLKSVGRHMSNFISFESVVHRDHRFNYAERIGMYPENGLLPVGVIPNVMKLGVRREDRKGLFVRPGVRHYVRVPLMPVFQKTYSAPSSIYLPCGPRFEPMLDMKDLSFKELRIVPSSYQSPFFEAAPGSEEETHLINSLQFYTEYYYIKPIARPKNLRQDYALAVVPNQRTGCTCFDTLTSPEDAAFDFRDAATVIAIVRNRFNRRRQMILEFQKKQGFDSRRSKALASLERRENDFLRDKVNKIARKIIDHCITKQIAFIILAVPNHMDEKAWGDIEISAVLSEKKLSKAKMIKAKEAFKPPTFPEGLLRQRLYCLCEQYGLTLMDEDNTYAFEAFFYDGQPLEEWGRTASGPYRIAPPSQSGYARKSLRLYATIDEDAGTIQTQNDTNITCDLYTNMAANILRRSAVPVLVPSAKKPDKKQDGLRKLHPFMETVAATMEKLQEKVLRPPITIAIN